MKTRQLSAVCSSTTQQGHPCTQRALEGSPHCYAHDSRFVHARREAAAKGGRLGGRGRTSISKELAEIRKLVGIIIELKAQDRLPLHIDCHMDDFLKLLKMYLNLAQLEIRTAKPEELLPKQAFANRRLISAGAIRQELEDLVHSDQDDVGEHETPDDPRGGAA